MSGTRRIATLAGALVLCAGAGACAGVLGIDDWDDDLGGDPGASGAGGASTASAASGAVTAASGQGGGAGSSSTSGSGAGGSGSSGSGGNGVGGGCDPSSCPAEDTECQTPACTEQGCDVTYETMGFGCTVGGQFCNGSGACVACFLGSDCSGSGMDCINNVCVAATCSDFTQNGDETAVDCGGSCPKCGFGQTCLIDGDCDEGVCNNTCQGPSCFDTVRNGNETDVDCGGGVCQQCGDWLGCEIAADCLGINCTSGECRCGDGTQNGLENGVDCVNTQNVGGCKTCSGFPCSAGVTCYSGVCVDNSCS
jgi:hypothetical protein